MENGSSEGERGRGMKLWAFAIAVVLVAGAFMVGYYYGGGNAAKPVKTKTIVDDAGRTVAVPVNPQKIISLAPSTTELLFALDLGDRIVAKDNNSDYPAEANLIKNNVSGFKWISYEVIESLAPDVIFAADINMDVVPVLESKQLTVVVLAPMSIEGVFSDIRLVGEIFGDTERANALLSSLKNRMSDVTNRTQAWGVNKTKVYLELDSYGGYWTFGPGSFGGELLVLAGGANIAGSVSEKYPALTSEFVVASDPSVIVYAVNPWISTTADTIKDRAGWAGIDAVKYDKIFSIDDNLVSRPGPRLIDGLEALAEILHPELFP